jgi:hypothetical protein
VVVEQLTVAVACRLDDGTPEEGDFPLSYLIFKLDYECINIHYDCFSSLPLELQMYKEMTKNQND